MTGQEDDFNLATFPRLDVIRNPVESRTQFKEFLIVEISGAILSFFFFFFSTGLVGLNFLTMKPKFTKE